MSSDRVRIGQLQLDPVTFDQALERIVELVDAREGGSVFTPNVDHVVKAETNDAFRAAYERADLCLVDGMWLLWASRLLNAPLPEKVSGSDLVGTALQARRGRRWRVYILGGGPGVAEGRRCKDVRRIRCRRRRMGFPVRTIGWKHGRLGRDSRPPS